MKGIALRTISNLNKYEKEALRLQSKAGSEWEGYTNEGDGGFPVTEDDIPDYLAENYIYSAAGEWSNSRIRTFLERDEMRD